MYMCSSCLWINEFPVTVHKSEIHLLEIINENYAHKKECVKYKMNVRMIRETLTRLKKINWRFLDLEKF